VLIDFNYTTQPLPGRYPVPVIGPMALIQESFINHLGKLAFRWIYWNYMLKGYQFPLPATMSMAGKWEPK
jgi:sulfide:quinone oxidoreductase